MAVAMTAAAAAYSAYQTYDAGEDQKKAARAQKDLANKNAAMLEDAANDATARGNEEAMLINRRARGLRGEQRAALAGQGVDVGAGTAMDLQNETSLLGEMDAEQTRQNAFREAWGIRKQASHQKLAGEYAYREGKNRAKALRNQAYGSVLGGAGDTYKAYYSKDTPSFF
jgi:predicted transcriptional regulator